MDQSAHPQFAHASEAELARILDFYDVRWRYEPDTFPIGWTLEGSVVESFSPDFYLPDMELYVELTTLKQSLVRKKNRKLRRLRELYPDIRIKLFYARDFRMLMLKFGRLALIDDLTGTTGQATPPRPVPAAIAADLVRVTGAAPGLPAEPGLPADQVEPADQADGASVRSRRRGRQRRRAAEAAAAQLATGAAQLAAGAATPGLA
jgi:hypoxanthine phosphoribosyltransferase